MNSNPLTILLTIFFFFDTHYHVIFTEFLNGVNKSQKDKGRKMGRKIEREREREKKEDSIKSKRENFIEEKEKIEKKTNKKKDRNE